MDIRYEKKARKFIESLDRPTKTRIHNGIIGLTVEPPKGDIKTMQSYNDGRMRLRIGKYRIIFMYSQEEQSLVLNIIDVDSRGDIYKR